MLIACALLLSGCGAPSGAEAPPEPTADTAAENLDLDVATDFDVEIKEKLFIAQTNDVYINTDEYLGKRIKLEGMFFSYEYPPTEERIKLVIRYGPGCCGDDGNAGFEVYLDDDAIALPEDNAWVEVIGELEWFQRENTWSIRLNVSHLEVKQERGAEMVTM